MSFVFDVAGAKQASAIGKYNQAIQKLLSNKKI